MGREGYWSLFWQTGLPEAWLLWRAVERPEGLAALSEERNDGTPV